MYIRRIVLENVRCFERLELDLGSENGARRWVMILGDNAVGKTTLLRAIAMGLCDETGASGLLGELFGEWVRYDAVDGTARIRIEFEPPDGGHRRPWIETSIKNSGPVGPEVEQETSENFPWDQIFVCGYGAARGVSGTESYREYSIVDAVYTFFKYEQRLQNPDHAMLKLHYGGANVPDMLTVIDRILMLKEGSTRFDRTGNLTISGPWGDFTPLAACADGYRATLTWIADVLGWALQYHEERFITEELSGIVLLDELEQHLHPKLQRRIVKQLRTQFPKIQFITSTHSPLCAAGTADLEDDGCLLFVLRRESDGRIESKFLVPPRGYRADQVLTSEVFGLPATRNIEVAKKLDQLRELYLKEQLSDEEERAFEELRAELERTVPEAAELEEDRQVQRELAKSLKEIEGRLKLESEGND
ncbi:MAG: AAA family ATPase [Chloroflexi bacterium]|nr:AAA family ATPase [Chloroflexota bacterium]